MRVFELTDTAKKIIELVDEQKMTYAQAAEALGVAGKPIPIGTVRSRLSRARARKRELMGDDQT